MAQRVTATVASFRIWRGSRATLHGLTATPNLNHQPNNLNRTKAARAFELALKIFVTVAVTVVVLALVLVGILLDQG